MKRIGKYLVAVQLTDDIWTIENNRNHILGEVEWYKPWKEFVFMPGSDTVYSEDCLTDIAAFIKKEMEARG